MMHITYAWFTLVSLLTVFSEDQFVTNSADLENVAEQIIGTWYLEEQEMLINGKHVDQHFEDLAAQLSAGSNYKVDPHMLAKKFRKGFNGIPTGTRFTFNDDFSYAIILPDGKVQSGMWRVSNGSDVLLQAANQELLLRIRDMDKENAIFSIREAKVDSHLGAGGYTVMELVLDLSR